VRRIDSSEGAGKRLHRPPPLTRRAAAVGIIRETTPDREKA